MIVALLSAPALPARAENGAEGNDESPHAWDGSRTIPLHRILLRDENNDKIVPTASQCMPFSSRTTCGMCHDYARISSGLHFNYMNPAAAKGRAGQPWILIDDKTGTQLPLSYRGWDHTWNPADVGMSPWQFTKEFGRHFPGGGAGEACDAPQSPEDRWEVSGPLEINCLMCHGASARQDNPEWVRQIARENFRWAATAFSGFGDVGGMASRMPATWQILQGPNPDDTEFAVAPYVRYNTGFFDRRGRAFVDIAAKPKDSQCLYCHSRAEVGQLKCNSDLDIHGQKGLACVACHRNGVDHQTIRGYESEADWKTDPLRKASSCQGCHLGSDKPETLLARGGRLGSPVPEHKGLPPAHFEKLSCTACHSGSWPGANQIAARTSRANRLGVYGRAHWSTTTPYIVEPVFMKADDGKITPHRVMWPSFWARLEKGQPKPLKPADVMKVAGDVLDVELPIAKTLTAFKGSTNQTAVFVHNRRLFKTNADLDVLPATYSGSNDLAGITWAWISDGALKSLVEIADPAAEAQPDEVNQQIKALLLKLRPLAAPGKPVMVFADRLFQLDDAGDVAASLLKDAVDAGEADKAKGAAGFAQWLSLNNRKLAALVSDFAIRTSEELAGTPYYLTEEQTAAALKALADSTKEQGAQFAYVGSGKLFTLDASGKLKADDHAAAAPTAWPLAHEVRPAAQALGAHTCTDCHSFNSPFFFANVPAVGPLKTLRAAVQPMTALQFQDGLFHKLLGLTFVARPYFKVLAFAVAGLIAAIVLAYGLPALTRLIRYLSTRK